MTRRCILALLAGIVLAACSRERESRMPVATGGDPRVGAQLIEGYSCGACHIIPGIRGADGNVGPPLNGIATRTFIAGHLPNNARNLEHWLRDPPAVVPGTAMPVLGLTDQTARDVAAYLYTLD
jgi:cytochrome c2